MKKPSSQELQGMTINERLITCNLFGSWDKAVLSQNKNEMIDILLKVAMTEEQAKETTNTILSNPKPYGV